MPDNIANTEINFYASVINSIQQVNKEQWNICANFNINTNEKFTGNPFLSYEFFSSLEDSGSVSSKTGWQTQHILLHKQDSTIVGILPNFIKTNSWGEYVFDHIFAEAWEKSGGQYYPKLLSAVPFTPISGPRFLIRNDINEKIAIPILIKALKELLEEFKLSSSHINFINHQQVAIASKNINWIKRTGIQFHWNNENYKDFEQFLSNLSSAKRKLIRRERKEIKKSSLSIKRLKGSEINNKHIDSFYKFYSNTIEKRWGGSYLNKKFWHLLIERLSDRILLVLAEDNNEYIAGAINLFDNQIIYGRNWGSSKNIKFLHFEVCYYQAIEFAIESGLKKVEAGAQGIHKLQRGYLPTFTYSMHYFNNESFKNAVSNYITEEAKQIENQKTQLTKHSPFKNLE